MSIIRIIFLQYYIFKVVQMETFFQKVPKKSNLTSQSQYHAQWSASEDRAVELQQLRKSNEILIFNDSNIHIETRIKSILAYRIIVYNAIFDIKICICIGIKLFSLRIVLLYSDSISYSYSTASGT